MSARPPSAPWPRITVLSGGVGGARLVDGLAAVLPDPSALTVIVNTADDWELWGLHISPDIDTVLYTLAGLAGPEQGWGIAGDTWAALEMMGRYGFPAWFRIGDRDLATHLARTAWLREGRRLTEAVRALAGALGVRPCVLPMCDEPVGTVVHTQAGRLPFQEYFVERGATDPVHEIEFAGIDRARPTPEALEAIRTAGLIVVAPSNPLVSIGPILAVPGMREALAASPGLRLAVTPLVGGRAVKGPTVEMLRGLGLPAEPAAVAVLYRDFLDVFVLDVRDQSVAPSVAAAGLSAQEGRAAGRPLAVACADTLMVDVPARRRLARDVLGIAAAHGAALPPGAAA
jgi:LPPG:FO 2-phospho-L-lactate transferase